jgi:lipoate-protein ligase A
LNLPVSSDRHFQVRVLDQENAAGARCDEVLIATSATGGPGAAVWEAGQGLAVPRTYERFPGFVSARESFMEQGWPVSVRHSGGGIVPQGPGIINLSLAYPAIGKPLDHSDAAYHLICGIISAALRTYGVESHAQPVEGSFCDGRYNLAIGRGPTARKVVGTAQLWRHHKLGGVPPGVQIVLVHALILAAVNVEAITERANSFEHAIGNDKRYGADRVASLHPLSTMRGEPAADFTTSLKRALLAEIAMASAP